MKCPECKQEGFTMVEYRHSTAANIKPKAVMQCPHCGYKEVF